MLAGKPDAGNLHVRFDEGEQRDWRKPPVALYSTAICGSHLPFSVEMLLSARAILRSGSAMPRSAHAVDRLLNFKALRENNSLKYPAAQNAR